MTEEDIRAAVFVWLEKRKEINGGVFSRNELERECIIENRIITLVGATGIWFPKNFRLPISITTTISGPYEDHISEDGYLNYSYRGKNINLRDNIGLRNAYIQNIPLVYFEAIVKGKYSAVFPIFIVRDDPQNLRVSAIIDPLSLAINKNLYTSDFREYETNDILRKYISVITKQRLHQAKFREQVLDAYKRQCSFCKLKHSSLLDAAHIVEDRNERGDPVIPNGLSLCKIHHAAFDKKIIGVTPDYKLKVRTDVLEEIDGPMLKYGLQSLENGNLILPNVQRNYPDKERLEIRYNEFLSYSY